MKHRSVICNKCQWIHFPVTSAYVHQWHKDWIEFWRDMDEKSRDSYGCKDSPPSTESYLKCFRCENHHTDFREASKEEVDRIFGSTVNPILDRTERLEK